MEEKGKNLNRKQSLITIITDIILIIVSFIMLIDSIICEKSTILIKQNLRNIFSTLLLKPIENITIATWNCPNEYEPLYETRFFSSEKGCYDFKKQEYIVGTCESHKLKDNCEEILDIKSLPMKIWREKLICIKRYKEINFTIQNISMNNSEYKKCGKVDVFNNFLYVNSSTPCPITFISISNESLYNDSDKIKLDDKYTLFYGNKTVENEIIPYDFFMSFNFPCLIVDYISNNSIPFLLLNKTIKSKYGCRPENFDLSELNVPNITNDYFYDKRFRLVNSMDYFDFLKQNDIYKDIYDSYQYYFEKNKYQNAKISLYQRGNIGINFTCISFKEIKDILDSINDSKIMQYKLLIFQLFNITFVCLFVSLLSLVKSNIPFDKKHIFISFLKLLFCGIFVYINLNSILGCDNNIFNINMFFSFKIEDNCLEKSTLSALKVYKTEKYFKETRKYNNFLYWGSIIYACVVFIQFVHLCFKTYIKFKNEKKMTSDAKEALNKHLGD